MTDDERKLLLVVAEYLALALLGDPDNPHRVEVAVDISLLANQVAAAAGISVNKGVIR